MHSWSYAQRTQLKDTSVRIIEIVPPSVGTDLHRDRVDPVRVAAACAIVCQADPSRQDDNKNTPNSLTVEQFMKETIEGFRSNADTIR
jgi:short-subunit dehydrogenase involved in D-alanine esterification of teichoic acids